MKVRVVLLFTLLSSIIMTGYGVKVVAQDFLQDLRELDQVGREIAKKQESLRSLRKEMLKVITAPLPATLSRRQKNRYMSEQRKLYQHKIYLLEDLSKLLRKKEQKLFNSFKKKIGVKLRK